jgi:hemerythrin-like domain-containing protein
MTDNNPISVLLAEHEVIQSAEDQIKLLDNLWEHDPIIYTRAVRQLITFFREYADGLHHRKEEKILFTALNDCEDFTLPEFISELEGHHEGFREYLRGIEELLVKHDYNGAYKLLNEYMNDLLDHIAAENDELFSIAETLLDDTQLEKIYFRFIDVDMEFGVDKIKEMEDVLSNVSLLIEH